MENLLLAADVGGTKTVMALIAPDGGTGQVVAEAAYESQRYAGLEAVVDEFLASREGAREKVRWASLCVAGPVIEGHSLLSNLGWELDESVFRERFGLAAVRLVNDLQATAYALPHLGPESILTLQPGTPVAHGPRAVIAPGTGLGEALLLPSGSGYRAFPSEGGNADFAPADDLQVQLLSFMRRKSEYVSYEHVCSGIGIPNVYRFLKETGVAEEPQWLTDSLASAADPTPVIVDAGLREWGSDTICGQALRLFASVLAAEAGNLALRVLATGGIYVGGGIPPRILKVLEDEEFVRTFRRKGHFSELLGRIPLYVIRDPRTALLGAARYGAELVEGSPAATLTRV